MKALFKRLFWLGRIFHIERRLRNRRTLTVAMFHRVLPRDGEAWQHSEQEYAMGVEEFDFCLRFFKRHYAVVSLDQVREAAEGEALLPANALLISFDDGWHDNVEYAQPLLAKHGLRATIFVNADAVRQQGERWWQDALVEVAHKRPEALVELAQKGEAYSVGQALLARSLDERCAALAPWLSYQAQTRQMLTAADLAALDRQVWDVGSHGLTHVPMTHVKDLDAELTESAGLLAGWCGNAIQSLAFPHGRYSNDIVRQAHEAGYKLVFSSDARLNDASAIDAPVLGRIHIPADAVRDEAQELSERSLALFLWRRQIA